MDKGWLIIKADGTERMVLSTTKPTLCQLQQIVRGYIEYIKVRHENQTRIMVINEEGQLQHLSFNAKASVIARRPIVGDVAILIGYKG